MKLWNSYRNNINIRIRFVSDAHLAKVCTRAFL